MIITILRKPLEGTVAENTLKHGCGALNITATRISTSDNLNGGAYAENPIERHDGKENWRYERGKAGDYVQPNGRWPANFILTHLEGCELKGTKKVKSNGHWTQKANIGSFYEGGWSRQDIDEGNKMSDEQGKETVENWDCVEGCPVIELDRQSGVSKSTGGRIGNAQGVYSNQGRTGWGTGHEKGDPGFGDEGGASRFFKQFNKKEEYRGEETISDWICEEGCPVKNLDKQTGVLVSGKDVNPTNSKVSGFFGKKDNYYSSEANYGDSGGASRFFKQFKKEDTQ